MKIACVLITHLRAKCELRRQPELAAAPAVIVDRSAGGSRVIDAFPAATGVTAGMALEEALSHNADTVVIEANEPAYRRVFQQVLTSLQMVSDRVEQAALGVAYVRLDGLETLHGGEERLLTALLNAVPQDLGARVGMAETKFPALVAARASRADEVTWVPEYAGAFLAPHPVTLLPLPATMHASLQRFGLRTLGDVSAMRVDQLSDQFGADGTRAWQLCHGIDDEPFIPLKHEESVTAHVSLPFVSTSFELFMVTLEGLLKSAYARPQMRGRYAEQATIHCNLFRSSSTKSQPSTQSQPPWEKVVNFKHGVGCERAARIIRNRLEADCPPAPVEEITLTLANLTGESATQMGLLRDAHREKSDRLVEADRQLQARMQGKRSLFRVVDIAPWHPAPELRALQVPIDPAVQDSMKPLATPTAAEVRAGADNRPVAVRLKNRWHRVACIDDQWCFDLWWLAAPLTRTYYRVRRADGMPLTLFRDQRDGGWYQQAA
jgi:nucleotidyltransferase/DNA polymerase involved in DNA repair